MKWTTVEVYVLLVDDTRVHAGNRWRGTHQPWVLTNHGGRKHGLGMPENHSQKTVDDMHHSAAGRRAGLINARTCGDRPTCFDEPLLEPYCVSDEHESPKAFERKASASCSPYRARALVVGAVFGAPRTDVVPTPVVVHSLGPSAEIQAVQVPLHTIRLQTRSIY